MGILELTPVIVMILLLLLLPAAPGGVVGGVGSRVAVKVEATVVVGHE